MNNNKKVVVAVKIIKMYKNKLKIKIKYMKNSGGKKTQRDYKNNMKKI